MHSLTRSRSSALFMVMIWLAGTQVSGACGRPLSDPAPGQEDVAAGDAPSSEATNSVAPVRLDGVDVSKFQGEIDWQAVKASGVVFAFARALEGVTVHDATFAANWRAMKEAGILRGAYDFYVAGDSPAEQVKTFTSLVSLEPGDLVPMVDIEAGSIGRSAPVDLIAGFHQYLDLMTTHYGAKPIIYTDSSFWNEHMDDSFGDYPLWIAEYGVESPNLPTGWSTWVLWQHSATGQVPGIVADVDLDVFNGGLDDLASYQIP